MSSWIGKHTIYGEDGVHETPYMTRYWLFGLRLHVFHRGDEDPDCHDHPWSFVTFPLRGYFEEYLVPGLMDRGKWHKLTRYVRPFRFHWRDAEHCHRVLGRKDGKRIITLVVRFGSGRPWGFWKNRNGEWCWVPWKKYIFEGGKNAPCGDEL